MLDLKKEIDQWGPVDGKVFYPSFWFYAMAKLLVNRLHTPWPVYIGIYDHDRMTYYWEKGEMQKRGELALEKWILNDKKRNQLWKWYYKTYGQMRKFVKGFKPEDFKNTQKMFRLLTDFWTYAVIPECANFATPDYLRKKLRGMVAEEKLNEVLGTLLAPEKLSFLQQSELELLEIGARYPSPALRAPSPRGRGERGQDVRALKKYAHKWYWVENSYYENKVLSANYFRKQLKKYSKSKLSERLKQIKNYPARVIARKQKIIRQYHLGKEIAHIAKYASFSIWWQDHRKATTWWFHSYIDFLNEKVAKDFKIKLDDLMHYTAEEWLRLIETSKKVNPAVIKNRKSLFLVTATPKSYTFTYGTKVKSFIRQLEAALKVSKQSTLQGIVATRSKNNKLRGRVRVLFSPRFTHAMKDGEILVAPMTSPDYITAMRRAKAIITDVGGLMSHAAVVSRELGIPCIVNTKIATEVLKDGDLVEVDANKGIVKLLKKVN